jgi:hypothetical protein
MTDPTAKVHAVMDWFRRWRQRREQHREDYIIARMRGEV